MIYITHDQVNHAARQVALTMAATGYRKAYPIPRGGVPAAYAVSKHYVMLNIVNTPEEADCYIDDLIDSGATQARYSDKPFFALFDKREMKQKEWLIFPWEETEEKSAEDICVRLLQFIGEDPTREGLLETPKRMLKAWKHWTSGYSKNPEDIMKVFEDGAEGCDEMVVVKDIPIYSHCEHHLAAIIGTATVAYIPNGKIIGLSKIARLVEIYARRLQVQERLTTQIANAMETFLNPLGCGVVIRARHLCMESRGVEKTGSETVTSALRGVFKHGLARTEFLALERSK